MKYLCWRQLTVDVRTDFGSLTGSVQIQEVIGRVVVHGGGGRNLNRAATDEGAFQPALLHLPCAALGRDWSEEWEERKESWSQLDNTVLQNWNIAHSIVLSYLYLYIKKKMAEIIGNKNYSWPFCVGFSVIRFRAAVCHQQCAIWQNRWFPVGYGWLQIPPKSSCLT